MGIVQLALKRPYTFVVMALLIVVLGVTAIRQMRTDIFPEIDIPVVTVIWTYKGMEATEVERRITTYSEYAISSNVNDIKRIESQTLSGVGVIKIYFHPGVDIGVAMSQVTSTAQAIRALMPPGIQPPIIVRYNASSVPILQISLSSETMSEGEVYDYGLYILRTQLSTVQGLTMPTPAGGRERQIMVDIDPQLLNAKSISPKDVSDAINAYNLAYPTGVARIDTHEYPVTLNNTPLTPATFNDIRLKLVNGATVYLRDVAQVRDGSTSQTTIVRRNGQRGALVTLLKNGKASTLDIVGQVKAMMPEIQASAPPGMKVELLFDQSLFVTAAIEGVVAESIIAGLLTAAMILLFLGSWRSTLIVAVSIPLAILSSIVMLYLLGHSLNVMTLGGLALAVGVPVLMGAIMSIGVATANSILLVTFANEQRSKGKTALEAALEAGRTRMRPVLMTALAMIIGMLPMSLGLGEGGEQNAPLGRAVIGGLLVATLTTLLFVPVVYSLLRKRQPTDAAEALA